MNENFTPNSNENIGNEFMNTPNPQQSIVDNFEQQIKQNAQPINQPNTQWNANYQNYQHSYQPNFEMIDKKKRKGKKTFGKGALAAACIIGLVGGTIGGGLFGLNYIKDDIINSTVSQVTSIMSENGSMSNNYVLSDTNTSKDTKAEFIPNRSNVINKMLPSVVDIRTTTTTQNYFGMTQEGEGAGTGFVIKIDNDNAYLITNNHVISGANEIGIQFHNTEEYVPANVVGTQPENDLAIISVSLSDLKTAGVTNISPVTFGNSDDIRVGDSVIAIGNSLGQGISATSGMISVTNKNIEIEGNSFDVFQTDAAINPGNSGGPLIDENGNVIGVNTAKLINSSEGSVEGMAYAIPSNIVVEVIDSIIESSNKAFMGITGTTITEEIADAYSLPPMGVIVIEVVSGGSAEISGIQSGDIITSLQGQPITSIENLQEKIQSIPVGDKASIKILRDGQTMELTLTLKSRSETPVY
ncbi:MAG: S1C family serine protease [Lachnospirales bacterium]